MASFADFVLIFENLPFSSPFMLHVSCFTALYSFLFKYLLVLFVYYYWYILLYNNQFKPKTFLARPKSLDAISFYYYFKVARAPDPSNL